MTLQLFEKETYDLNQLSTSMFKCGGGGRGAGGGVGAVVCVYGYSPENFRPRRQIRNPGIQKFND